MRIVGDRGPGQELLAILKMRSCGTGHGHVEQGTEHHVEANRAYAGAQNNSI